MNKFTEQKLKNMSFMVAPTDENLRREETVVLLSDAINVAKDCYNKGIDDAIDIIIKKLQQLYNIEKESFYTKEIKKVEIEPKIEKKEAEK